MAESHLEKLLRLADVSQTEPAALGVVDKGDDEAHDHLMRECPWYASVSEGQNATDPSGCKAATGGDGGSEGGALVKFTPRTPEASTVPQPTVPPGGPGLFHVKGLELPPYIQHLYKHLVARYGKHRAYGVAVGVVEKWAKGVNPGGWKTKSGKGKRTHPDVQAAAAKNVAQWEKDRATAHAQSASHHVKATALMPKDQPFPGDKKGRLPVIPRGGDSANMYIAHRMDDTLRHLSHARERLHVAHAEKSRRAYHMIHVNNHLITALNNCHSMVDGVKESFPAEAKELEAVTKTMGLAKAVDEPSKVASFAHLLQTILYHLAHAKRHAAVMENPNPSKVWEFNYDHCKNHVDQAQEHTYKLSQHIQDNYPDAGKWLKILTEDADPNTPMVPLAATDGPTITKEQANYRDADREYQDCHNCINRVGGSCRLVLGGVAPKYVCDSWEGAESSPLPVAMAAPASWPSGKAYAKSFLTPPRDVTVSAPGAGAPQRLAYGQLKQEPSQTTSPSPPLPPEVDLPTPKELRGFAKDLSKMEDDEDYHLRGAQLHLESAATKMPNNPISALASLRSAQMAIQDTWRERVMNAKPRIAYVFSVNTPPAEQSSQQQVWAKEQARIGEMQGAASQIAAYIDRVRRAYFRHAGMEPQTAGGGLAGQPNARL